MLVVHAAPSRIPQREVRHRDPLKLSARSREPGDAGEVPRIVHVVVGIVVEAVFVPSVSVVGVRGGVGGVVDAGFVRRRVRIIVWIVIRIVSIFVSAFVSPSVSVYRASGHRGESPRVIRSGPRRERPPSSPERAVRGGVVPGPLRPQVPERLDFHETVAAVLHASRVAVVAEGYLSRDV